ncbi:MAG: hypothetical protein K2J61_01910 [Clostridia bacterium]|nr:hypothetical protein [Clostridia bacterium]
MEDIIEVLLQILYIAFSKMGGNPQLEDKRRKRHNVLCNVLLVITCCVILGCLGTGIGFLIAGGSLHLAGIILVSVGAGVFALVIIFIVIAISVGLRKLKKKTYYPVDDDIDDNVIDVD